MELNLIQLIAIVIVVFMLCITYLISKYIVVSNETKVALRRVEKNELKVNRRADDYEVKNVYLTNAKPDTKSIFIKDTDPTMCFPRVQLGKNYIADMDPGSTSKMPKVEEENEQELEEE